MKWVWVPLVIAVAAVAQDADSLNRIAAARKIASPLRLDHADELENQRIQDRDVMKAYGHVEFSQDTLRGSCDEAAFFRDAQLAVMIGRVRLWDPRRTIYCGKARYYARLKKAVCEERVIYVDSTVTLVADSLVYYQNLEHAYAFGSVVAFDSAESATLRSERLFYDVRKQFVSASDRPVLIQHDSTKFVGENTAALSRGWPTFPVIDSLGRKTYPDPNDQVTMTARTMESWLDSSRVTGRDSVRFHREKLLATGERAEFNSDRETLRLWESPRATYDHSRATGQEMKVQFRDRDMSSITIDGDAKGYSAADSSRDHRIEAKTIVMDIREKEVHLMRATGNALSVYYLENGEGKNELTGPSIVLFFRDKKLSRFRVEGGAEGTYFPQHLIEENP